jgi:hypothetical protein
MDKSNSQVRNSAVQASPERSPAPAWTTERTPPKPVRFHSLSFR